MPFHVINTQLNLTDEGKAYLEANGCALRFKMLETGLTEDEICQELRGVDAVLAGSEGYTEKVFQAADKLKIVARFGVGYDHVDLAAATRHGVWVTNTPGATSPAVADFTIGFIISLVRHISIMDRDMKDGKWVKMRGRNLEALTVGVVGAGSIGKEVIKRLSGFGSKILAYDVVEDSDFAGRFGVQYLPLDDLLARADVVTIHCALTEHTRGLLDQRRVGLMKPGAYLVNTARAPIVDKAALVEALQTERLAGAALDVHDPAPCAPDDPLARHPHVIATPWTSAYTQETGEKVTAISTRDVVTVLKGGAPKFALNRL